MEDVERQETHLITRGLHYWYTERDFYNVVIREPRMSTDNWMVLVELKGEGGRRNRRYCKERSIYPIVTPMGVPIQEGDSHFPRK